MIAVKVEISRNAQKLGVTSTRRAESQIAVAIAQRLAAVQRERVQGRGDLAGQTFPGWDAKHKWYATAARYPDHAQGKVGPSGAEFFPTSAAYHQMNGTRPGTYSTTGGMWDGLSVVVESPTRASIQFRGRSIGASPNWRVAKRGKKKGQKLSVGLKENNKLKAWTVQAKHGINVLALTDGEMRAVAAATVEGLALGVQHDLSYVGHVARGATVAECVASAFQGHGGRVVQVAHGGGD
jgi:hypothetical protein